MDRDRDRESTRSRRLVIDSRDRDRVAYPSPNAYEIDLDDDLFDVTVMRLVVADVPFSAYLVSEGNRRIPVQMGGSGPISVAALETGDYDTPQALAAEIAVALNAAVSPPQDAFTCSYDARKDVFTVVNPTTSFALAFSLQTGTGTAARLLGFVQGTDYASTWSPDLNANAVSAPFRRDFEYSRRYVVLNISQPPSEAILSKNNKMNRSFAIIPVRQRSLNIDDTTTEYLKRWDPPIARLSRLQIRFTDYDGLPYDFQNREHRLEFVLESLRQTRKYSIAVGR